MPGMDACGKEFQMADSAVAGRSLPERNAVSVYSMAGVQELSVLTADNVCTAIPIVMIITDGLQMFQLAIWQAMKYTDLPVDFANDIEVLSVRR